MMKSILYRVLRWCFYTLLLSLLPIIILFMLAAIFEYDFTLANLANLFVSVCGLSVAILRDSMGISDFIGRCIRHCMILACILSSTLFGALCVMQGENMSLSPKITENLLFMAFAFLGPIAIIGIFTQIYMELRSFHEES